VDVPAWLHAMAVHTRLLLFLGGRPAQGIGGPQSSLLTSKRRFAVAVCLVQAEVVNDRPRCNKQFRVVLRSLLRPLHAAPKNTRRVS